MAGYPFTTINPNAGIVPVPDPRLETLGQLLQPPKLTPATIEFVDIAGLIQGASQGEGLGNQFLAHIRDVDLLVHVVRGFEAPDIPHIAPTLDPVRDIEIIDTELLLADLEIIRRQLVKLEKASKSGDKKILAQLQLLQRLETFLNQGRWAAEFPSSQADQTLLAEVPLLTRKPYLLVANISEAEWRHRRYLPALEKLALERQVPLIPIMGDLEAELADLPPEERQEFLAAAGMPESGLTRLIQASFRLLGLITFYTIVGPEVRAWTVPAGTPAVPRRRQDPFGYGQGFYQGRSHVQRRSDPPGDRRQGQRGRSDACRRQGLCDPGWGNCAVSLSGEVSYNRSTRH